jgi:carbonic anhydrase
MLTRRTLLAGAAALGFSATARAQDACQVFTPDLQSAVDPARAIKLLMDGNGRFVSGTTINCDLARQVKETANGQAPFAAVVGCIDSRVPPELVFDQRLGAIFSARIAGNFVNTDIIGSLEFACKVAGAKAIMILGHNDCGAIKGAVDNVHLGNLTAMLANIMPAVDASKTDGERTTKNKGFVQAVADLNAKLAAKMVLDRSPVLREMIDAKKLTVVAAMHDLSTGRVTLLD